MMARHHFWRRGCFKVEPGSQRALDPRTSGPWGPPSAAPSRQLSRPGDAAHASDIWDVTQILAFYLLAKRNVLYKARLNKNKSWSFIRADIAWAAFHRSFQGLNAIDHCLAWLLSRLSWLVPGCNSQGKCLRSFLDHNLHPERLCSAKLELSSRPSAGCLGSSDPHSTLVLYSPFCSLWCGQCSPPQVDSPSGLFCSSVSFFLSSSLLQWYTLSFLESVPGFPCYLSYLHFLVEAAPFSQLTFPLFLE